MCACVLMCVCQVVVKTKTDYDGESKKGKLRSPKIAEFSISIIEGVSERLKVRPCALLLVEQALVTLSFLHTHTHVHTHRTPETQLCPCSCVSWAGAFVTAVIAFPLSSTLPQRRETEQVSHTQ